MKLRSKLLFIALSMVQLVPAWAQQSASSSVQETEKEKNAGSAKEEPKKLTAKDFAVLAVVIYALAIPGYLINLYRNYDGSSAGSILAKLAKAEEKGDGNLIGKVGQAFGILAFLFAGCSLWCLVEDGIDALKSRHKNSSENSNKHKTINNSTASPVYHAMNQR